MDAYEKLMDCHAQLRKITAFQPKIAVVLGSGLGGFADEIKVHESISYSELKGFPVSTVPGHTGRFIMGHSGDTPVIIMQGRVHYYEGYSMSDVVLPIRLMGLMGAKAVILTNAAGSVNLDYKPGDFMLMKDHISSLVPSPLAGANMDKLGPRFPDMSGVYSSELRAAVREAAKECGASLREGVYIQLSGPEYETPAEVRMCRTLGADAVGMSTACEAMAANHMGLKVAGISCISNLGCGIGEKPLTHDEVRETADKAAPVFKRLLAGSIARIAKLV